MIELKISQESVDDVVAGVELLRQRILANLKQGMLEAMQGLAWTVADKLTGSPIVSRSGALLEGVLESPKVTETAEVIRGTVTAETEVTLGGRLAKHLGIWLEEGTHVPAVGPKLFEFAEADGVSLYSHGHAAFQVRPRPFMNPSLREYQTTITSLLEAAVAAAIEE